MRALMRVQPLTWRNSWRFLGSAGQTFASGQSRGDEILIKILCVDVWKKNVSPLARILSSRIWCAEVFLLPFEFLKKAILWMNPSKIMDYLSYRGDLHAYYHILNASCGLFTEDFGGWQSFSFYLRFLQDCLSDVPNEILFCSISVTLGRSSSFFSSSFFMEI